MVRLDVPLSIAEAPTDRLRVSVDIDGNKRLIPGARAPTIGQAAGEGAGRTPSQYLLGAQVQENQQTTVQIVQRALPGTQVFDFLDQAARDQDEIDLDFRAFGSLKHVITVAATKGFMIGVEANGLSELSLHADVLADIGLGNASDKNVKLVAGSMLAHVKDGTEEGSDNEDFIEKAATPSVPDIWVVDSIIYTGTAAKAYVKGVATQHGFPNASGSPNVVIAGDVAICDPSVHWTAKGNATSFQPGFGEDSALYTLDVTLTESMPRALPIHPADVNEGNKLPT